MAINKTDKVLNVPTLRFPGFTDKWEKKRVGDIAKLSKGAGISKDDRSISGVPCILYGELYTTYNSEIINKVVSKTELPLDNLVQSEGNDVIIPSSGESAIDISTARCITTSGILLGGDLNIIRLKNDDGRFLSYQLNGVRKLDIAKVAQGVSVVHLYGDALKSISVSLPHIDEQKKIADFLSLLDERIALQSKLIDRLKSLMDGIVVKHWKGVEKGKFCLSDLGEAFSVMNLSKDDLTEDGKYCIIYGELFTTYDAIIDNVVSHTDKVDRLTLSGDNDLLFPASTTVNAYSLISPSAIIKRDVVLGGDMFGIHISSEHSAEYISLIINAIYRNKLSKYAKGSTIIHLHYGDIKNVQIELPELEMQLYLVGVVKRLRAKLSIETDYLTALNNVKQSLLSAMFI